MALIDNSVLLLLVTVTLGDLIGRVRVKGFSLGASAVLAVALLFGHFGHQLPAEMRVLGLVLFVYSVGLQAGPGFLGAFRAHGLSLTLGAVAMVATGALVSLACAWFFGFDAGTATGLLAGALTSTPGLAIAVEATEGQAAAAAYGVTYVFGVVGVVLFLRFFPGFTRADLLAERESLVHEQERAHPPLTFHHVEVVNPALFGRTVGEIRPTAIAPVTLTRLLRRGAVEPVLVEAATVLEEGDRLRVVGSEEALARIELLLGPPVAGAVEFERGLVSRKVLVSHPQVVGTPLGSLSLPAAFNVQVSRLVRAGVELPPMPTVRLQRGDRLVLVGHASSVHNVGKMLGDDESEAHLADVPPLLLGLLIGFLIGQIRLPIPGAGTISLGVSGGVLLAGLVLGRLHKTGPFQWQLPTTANTFVRNLGLLVFLAAVGTGAGGSAAETLREQGAPLLFAGALATLLPLFVGAFIARRVQRLPVLRTMGVLAGGMTSTPGLGASAGLPGEAFAAAAYATVYPAALLGMVVAVEVVAFLLP